MDLQTAVALSILPGVSPRRTAGTLQEASRQLGTDPTQAAPPLEIFLEWLHVEPAAAWDLSCRLRERADKVLRRATADGLAAVGWGDARYPTSLASIADPPPVLWVRGDSTVLEQRSVAIVGSRRASPYAVEVAEELGTGLAARGVTVVSGLARGVDSAAHRGALESGRTVAVLGSGVDVIYPAEHDVLARAIAKSGALVSELLPGSPPRPQNFPSRNRLISGLSLAVVIVEASEHSGSLITARCGLEQGREVMAVPGNVLSGRNRGSHALLKDGAKVVEGVDDILEELGFDVSAPGGEPFARNSLKTDRLLEIMIPGDEYDLDLLIERSGLAGPALLARLLDLELKGVITRVGGGRFVRVRGKC